MKTKKRFLSAPTVFFAVLTALNMAYFVRYVDMKPQVETSSFFSTEDPTYQADNEITKLFERKDSQIIISISGDIRSLEYQKKVESFSDLLLSFDAVLDVISLTHGPKKIEDAINGPLWQRLLLGSNEESSNVVVIVDEARFKDGLIPKIEHLIQIFNAPDFKIRISGFPYVIELIGRNLLIDLNLFTLLAFVIFSIAVRLIFHSWKILLGMIFTCLNAGMITFIITDHLGLRVGILTANLATIIFILSLSPMIFLTFNWRSLQHQPLPDGRDIVDETIFMTLPGSFWSMFTTLGGFLSCLFVQAKPLRELAIAGGIGTLIAFLLAYGIYPSFLRLNEGAHQPQDHLLHFFLQKIRKVMENFHHWIVAVILVALVWGAPYLWQLNTDPSSLSYFDPDSEITKGLEQIDRDGGSSPLVIVIKDRFGRSFNTNKVYKELWSLQEDLEKHKDVGIIVSLPTLLAEGKRIPLSFVVPLEQMLKIMENPKYGSIANSFVSKDRKYALFILRMNESGRTRHRLEILEELKQITERHDFEPYLMGGIYALQAHLSQHIASSLIFGITQLILAFSIIAFIVSLSVRTSIAMTMSLGLVPLCILGMIGYLKIPLDTISSPGANLTISMGIDAMIYMTFTYRRLKTPALTSHEAWYLARQKMWEPIITSMFIVTTGFGIFFFSSFPPTQRFGGSIVFGTLVAAMTALYIFPLLASAPDRKKPIVDNTI